MGAFGWMQFALYLAALTKPLGLYLVRVMDSQDRLLLSPVLAPVERFLYRLLRVEPQQEQGYRAYTRSLLAFTAVSGLFTYAVQRFDPQPRARRKAIDPWSWTKPTPSCA